MERTGDPNRSLKYRFSNLATRRLEWDGSQLEGNLGLLEDRLYDESLEKQLLAKNLAFGLFIPKKTRLEGHAIELKHSILQEKFGPKTDLPNSDKGGKGGCPCPWETEKSVAQQIPPPSAGLGVGDTGMTPVVPFMTGASG